jgi:hypothetical protein
MSKPNLLRTNFIQMSFIGTLSKVRSIQDAGYSKFGLDRFHDI